MLWAMNQLLAGSKLGRNQNWREPGCGMPVHQAEIQVQRPKFLGGQHWTLRRLSAITVLLGRNGSGKSLLLRAIRSADPRVRHYIIPERTGDISFDANLLLEVIDAGKRANRSSSNFSPQYR